MVKFNEFLITKDLDIRDYVQDTMDVFRYNSCVGFGKGPTYTAMTMTESLFCSTWKLVEYHVYFVHFLMVAAVCRISGLFCSFFLVAAVKFGGIATFCRCRSNM